MILWICLLGAAVLIIAAPALLVGWAIKALFDAFTATKPDNPGD